MKQQGFNHNIRYQDVLFHVQTEDYGLELHQIVTQLFFGGQIVQKRTMDYKDLLDLEDFEASLKARMQKQHKEMLKDLVDGKIAIPENIQNKMSNKSNAESSS